MFDLFSVFVFWTAMAVVIGILASKKNRSGFGWFFLSLFISPIVTGILVLVLGQVGKQCPACTETVKTEANVCKHCGYSFSPVAPAHDENGDGPGVRLRKTS